MKTRLSPGSRQRGAVAIITALSLAVLVGFVGLALDLGRLYVNKTELQSAADACALAAANELVCDTSVTGTCPSTYLLHAEGAGIFVGGRSRKDFQDEPVTIAPADVRFSTTLDGSYQPRASADPSSRYAMCIARATGIAPWFMGVLGMGPNMVSASAVATLAPGQTFCSGLPLGVCKKPGAAEPDYGYSVGEWISSSFTSANNREGLDGNFRWINFSTTSGGGDSELRNQLAGSGAVCGIRVKDNVRQAGQQQGAKSAYNTRFGLYPSGANAYTPQTAPPDRTGYAYPNKSPGNPVIDIGTSAYADYRRRQGIYTPFTDNQYGIIGQGGNVAGGAISQAEHSSFGSERRLSGVPIIDCEGGSVVKILGVACVLMLNPMSNGASGTIYLEYRGAANSVDSPCRSAGLPGSSTSGGPRVPTLVQ